jgi:predicted AAA+ superfamily ATPase
MNNSYSSPEKYLERWITPSLQQASRDHAVVVLTGARQVGKSTLLLNAEPFRDWRYHSMDEFDVLDQARRDPEALWAGTDRVILDEVQKVPDLLVAVKRAVDRNPGKYRLAGRAVYFILGPMALGEIHQTKPPDILTRLLTGEFPAESSLDQLPSDPDEILIRGLMPALLTLDSPQSWTRWWDGYVATYLERDLRQVAQIDALLDFRKTMELVALRSGQLLNQSEVARDAQLTQPTVHRYLNLLETTNLFERLPAYTVSHTTRLLKSPKAFLNDPGLAVFLSGYYELEDLKKSREYGAYFETLIYHHLRILSRLITPAGRLSFWRRRDGTEVDFVVEHGRHAMAVEVKATKNPGYRDIAGLQAFLKENTGAAAGLLLHSGREIKRLDEKIVVVPWIMVTG